MNIKEFITTTIKEISDAINELTASEINVITSDNFKHIGEHYTTISDNGIVRNIDFELSVEVTEKNSKNGEIGIQIAKAKTDYNASESTISKIRFTIPVSFHKSNSKPHQQ